MNYPLEPYDVPILIIGWRRSESIKRILEILSSLQPRSIYIALDGPRQHRYDKDIEEINLVKLAFEHKINWDCNVMTNYALSNKGCCLGVMSAITWFFSLVDYGIILEDDCIPSRDFFQYTSTLLEKYSNDLRIWSISGYNNQLNIARGNSSYFFSRFPSIWGWATWKDRWSAYDFTLAKLPRVMNDEAFKNIFLSASQQKFFERIWLNMFKDPYLATTWDYQWTFTCMINNGLTIIPNVSLVENVGFDEFATHTKSPKHYTKALDMEFPMVHPSLITSNHDADTFIDNHVFGARSRLFPIKLIKKLLSSIQLASK